MILNNLEVLMSKQGISRKELSNKLGTAEWYIQEIIENRRQPAAMMMNRLCRIMGCGAGDILYYREEK